jgi:hypothetical protein
MIRRVSEPEQTDIGQSVALFRVTYPPEQMSFIAIDLFDHGVVYFGNFVTGFTFPLETGEVEADYSVSEHGAYLLATEPFTFNDIVLAVKVNGHWFITNRVYAP